MARIREEDARTEFERALTPTAEQVERAKHFVVAQVKEEPVQGSALIRSWWIEQKAPPEKEVVLLEEYGFLDQCHRAANHWVARLCAARAIKDLANDGYIEAADESFTTEQVHQAYTTVVERSGGTSGGWSLDRFSVRFPTRVRKGVFAKEWRETLPQPQTVTIDGQTATAGTTASDSGLGAVTNALSPRVFAIPQQKPDGSVVAVMMPFAAEFNAVSEVIRQAAKDAGLEARRADDIWEDSTFIQDVFSLIYRSSAVVVDFTGRNANVMYETGIAHTLGRPVVPITQNLGDIPSDLRAHRALFYLCNHEGLEQLRTGLSARLRTLFANDPS